MLYGKNVKFCTSVASSSLHVVLSQHLLSFLVIVIIVIYAIIAMLTPSAHVAMCLLLAIIHRCRLCSHYRQDHQYHRFFSEHFSVMILLSQWRK